MPTLSYVQRELTLSVPLQLGRTVRTLQLGSGDPAALVTDTHVSAALRGPAGPVAFRLVQNEDRLRLEAWGSGSGWLGDHLEQLVGLDDIPEALVPVHEVVRQRHLRNPGFRLGASHAVFDSVVHWIVHQKVTGKGAGRSMRDLVRIHGEPAPGPLGLRLGPTPEAIGAMAYEDFHPLGIERKRADVLRGAARRHRRIEEILGMSATAAMTRLSAISGIGPWTSANVVGPVLGDPDAVAVGDYHTPNTVSWALAGEERGTDERMLELLESYRGQRRRVVLLLKGIGAPKFGPRSPVREIRVV